MIDPDKPIESMGDVREVLAHVREQLQEVSEMDLNDPNAAILYEPLVKLRAQLGRIKDDIEAVLEEREGDEDDSMPYGPIDAP